jgi:hypothetical protein
MMVNLDPLLIIRIVSRKRLSLYFPALSHSGTRSQELTRTTLCESLISDPEYVLDPILRESF